MPVYVMHHILVIKLVLVEEFLPTQVVEINQALVIVNSKYNITIMLEYNQLFTR